MNTQHPQPGIDITIEPANPPHDGILFVNHQANNRSGHLGHALVEYSPGKILAFFPNCSNANNGHTGDGWMEFKRSEDGGRTWSPPQPLAYSQEVYESAQGWSVMCEKAVRADDGAIVLFALACDKATSPLWRPYGIPMALRSSDGGKTWSDPVPVSDVRGRVYDVIRHRNAILALEFCNDATDTWTGTRPEHVYRLYASTDHGRSFSPRSTLPFDTLKRGYGTMTVRADGSLAVYIYNQADEHHLDCVVSHDDGATWGPVHTVHFAKRIRNPQIASFKGGYVLHGRSGNLGDEADKGHLVLYTSRDGMLWDSGRFLQMRIAGQGAYSNNLLVHDPEGQQPPRLLIQASHAYDRSMTNIHHWWLT